MEVLERQQVLCMARRQLLVCDANARRTTFIVKMRWQIRNPSINAIIASSRSVCANNITGSVSGNFYAHPYRRITPGVPISY